MPSFLPSLPPRPPASTLNAKLDNIMGLDELGLHGNAPNGFMWLTDQLAPNALPGVYFCVDFQEEIRLSALKLWNYNEGNGYETRGVRDVAFFTAPDGAAPDPASADPYNDPNWKHVMDETYSAADGENYRYQGEPLTVFPRPVKARYLLMRIKSDQGSFAKGDYHTGFSKIQFYTSKRGETLLMVR